ncbi:hypothetical protein ACWCXX_24925 [Streptomyces sp. NPDC001732]
MRINGIDGFHIVQGNLPCFHSGFTRWIEQRATDQSYPALVEMLGIAARDRDLTEHVRLP